MRLDLDDLSCLARLQELTIRFCDAIQNIDALGKLSHLQWLSLCYIKTLDTLPSSIGQLTALSTLYASNNQLRCLPQEIGHLSSLTSLDLGTNQLTSLPDSIGNLQNLTDLRLSDNQLEVLPESIADLPRLKSLRLDGNPLKPETRQWLRERFKPGVLS